MDVIAVVEIADVLVLVMGEVLHVWLARWRDGERNDVLCVDALQVSALLSCHRALLPT